MRAFVVALSVIAAVSLLPLSASAGCGKCEGDHTGEHAKKKTAYQTLEGAKDVKAELGCAGCIYGKKDVKGCKTAVKIDDKIYMVKAVAEEAELDAHEAGLCKAGRKATLTGKVVENKFLATKVKLQEEDS